MNILDLITKETSGEYKKDGDRYRGPCPFCGGTDRFSIFTKTDTWHCFSEGGSHGCGKGGDDIQFIREWKDYSYKDACEYLNITPDERYTNDGEKVNYRTYKPLTSPGETWTRSALEFVRNSQSTLWSDVGAKALAWLHKRGLTDETIRNAGFGYNPSDRYDKRHDWGLEKEYRDNGKEKGLWLPRGIVIPWLIDGELWGVRIRLPQPVGSIKKYYLIPGGQALGLYNAEAVTPDEPVCLFEGEIDALTATQEGFKAVATGSTHGSRRPKWLARLSTASTILVCYDSDDAGEGASEFWVNALKNAKRWRPYWGDANQMKQDGVNIADWLSAGIGNEFKMIKTVDDSINPDQMTITPDWVKRLSCAWMYEAQQSRIEKIGLMQELWDSEDNLSDDERQLLSHLEVELGFRK